MGIGLALEGYTRPDSCSRIN